MGKKRSKGLGIHLGVNILLSLGVIALIILTLMGAWGCPGIIILIATGVVILILMFSWAIYISKLLNSKDMKK